MADHVSTGILDGLGYYLLHTNPIPEDESSAWAAVRHTDLVRFEALKWLKY